MSRGLYQMSLISAYRFSAAAPGPALLLFGGIHGNEICGIEALHRLKSELESGALQLSCGSVTLVPVCNPEAHRQDRRFVEENLNRIFTRHDNPANYEQRLANELTVLVETHDALLDLHDVPQGDHAFTFIDYETPQNIALAQAMGLSFWITGWPEVFKTCPSPVGYGAITGQDTQACAQTAGKPSILIECGLRKSVASIEVAYQSARRFLSFYGMLPFDAPVTMQATHVYRIEQLVWKESEGNFAKPWQHLDDVSQGEVIARYADGRELTSPFDGKIIIPSPNNPVGHEWYYLGRADAKYREEA